MAALFYVNTYLSPSKVLQPVIIIAKFCRWIYGKSEILQMAFSPNPNFADGYFADGKFCRWILQMAFWAVLEILTDFCVLWSEQTVLYREYSKLRTKLFSKKNVLDIEQIVLSYERSPNRTKNS